MLKGPINATTKILAIGSESQTCRGISEDRLIVFRVKLPTLCSSLSMSNDESFRHLHQSNREIWFYHNENKGDCYCRSVLHKRRFRFQLWLLLQSYYLSAVWRRHLHFQLKLKCILKLGFIGLCYGSYQMLHLFNSLIRNIVLHTTIYLFHISKIKLLEQKIVTLTSIIFFVYLAVSNCLHTQTFHPFHSWQQGYNWPRSQEAAAIFVDRNENSWQRHLCLHRVHGGGGAGVNWAIKSLFPSHHCPLYKSH